MNSFPTLESSRLQFRQFTPADQENVFQGLSHPEVIKYYGISFSTFEATKEQMDWFANLEKEGTGMWWAICDKENGVFVGAGGFNDLSKEHCKAEIGFWLLPAHWGKGYMTEAMPIICQCGFEQLGLHRIEGFVETNNANCKKALAKLKFIQEGTMVDCEVKNEQFISVDIYAKFNPSASVRPSPQA